MNIQHNVTLINVKNRNTLSLKHASKLYIIGFPERAMAKQIMSTIDPFKPMSLHRRYAMDVALDVKKSLLQMNIPIANVADTITIDVDASVTIPKKEYNSDETEYMSLTDVETIDFLMYPFSYNIGVIMPYDIEQEYHDKYIFRCSMVDPSTDVLFSKHFKDITM